MAELAQLFASSRPLSSPVALEGTEQITFYRGLLLHLGTQIRLDRAKQIFADAQTSLKQPRNLKKLVEDIDQLDWFSAKEEGLGDLYEGLLERNAGETKSGAGQYFTPRQLINSIVRLVQPVAGEVIQDPAAGTGGFLPRISTSSTKPTTCMI